MKIGPKARKAKKVGVGRMGVWAAKIGQKPKKKLIFGKSKTSAFV